MHKLFIHCSDNLGADQSGLPPTTCILSSNGNIVCVPAITYSFVCETDYSYWPFDEQTCDLRLGSWTHAGEEVDFGFRKNAVSCLQLKRNPQIICLIIKMIFSDKYGKFYTEL